MRKKNILKVHMLGEFYMENKHYRFPQDTKKSVQLILLIAYLIAYRHTVVTKAKLIDILWKDEESTNPEGALRNLVYRARKELQKFFPDKDVQCILSKGNTYAWNSQVECSFDMEEMEELCQWIEKEANADIAYEQCTSLLQDYREDFLSEFSDQSWVELQKSAYDNLLMRATHHTCSLLMSKKRYDDVIRLSDILGFKYYANNHIHEYKLIAYCNTNQYSLALAYYRKLIDIYYSKLGIAVPDKIKEIYEEVLKNHTLNAASVEELERSLNENAVSRGTFYCDFDVFKNIYQMNLRNVRRSSKSRYLVLLTLEDASQESKEEDLQKDSDLLKNIIFSELRKNDVYSKCTPTQYSLIIATTTQEGCEKAIQRITDKFEEKKSKSNLQISYEYKLIN